LDDILLTGNNEAEHLATLDKVLTKLETAEEKQVCLSVDYLGHSRRIATNRRQSLSYQGSTSTHQHFTITFIFWDR